MTNKEKARKLALVLQSPKRDGRMLVDIIEAELNRFDAPEPKKWEPRGGEYFIAHNNKIMTGLTTKDCQLSGREYPTREAAERAAPLHRTMDRLINWMIEHCDNEIELVPRATAAKGEFVIVFRGSKDIADTLLQHIAFGEVEL